MSVPKPWLIGAPLLAAGALLLMAYKPSNTQGQRAFSAVSVATSADGRTVYVADLDAVWKSTDGGTTWTKVTPK